MSKKRKDMEAQIEELTLISDTYPGLPDRHIERDSLITSINNLLEYKRIVFVDWPDGYGKTTMLAQFVKKESLKAIHLFIESRWSYNPRSVKIDLCNQMMWILKRVKVNDFFLKENDVDLSSLLNRCYRKINKKGRRKGPFYIVIDGLKNIPDRDLHAREEIIRDLPFEAAGIKFVFSGEPSLLPKKVRSKNEIECLSPLPFRKDDTRKYLEDIIDYEKNLNEIHNTCRGIPGRLASVRRILERDVSPESVLQCKIDEAEDLFDVEWGSVKEEHREVLAMIAFPEFKLRTKEIAKVLNAPEHEIVSKLSPLSFINLEDDSNKVSFVSEAFRRYAAEKLSALKTSVRNAVVDHLIENIESERSIRHLPVLLGETGKHEELIEILSPDYFYKVLERGQSLGFINQVADLAFHAAEKQRGVGSVARFSLHKSAVNELWGAHARRSEVRALMALEEFEEAMALTDTALSDVERLHLLAVIAKAKKEQTGAIDDDIDRQIRQLVADIDPADLQDHGGEIAADLLNIDPELALRIVEFETGAGTGEHSLDVAYLKLTFSELMRSQNRSEPTTSDSDYLDDIHSKIQDPVAKEISSKLKFLVRDYSAEKVLRKAKSFEKTGDRLYFLRLWTQSHKRSEEAGAVIEYALDQITRNTDYGHDAGMLRELAEPLPYLKSHSEIKNLVHTFDQQKQQSILVQELIRLEILLTKAEYKIDPNSAEERLLSLYYDLLEVGDLATRTEGWARLIGVLSLREQRNELEKVIMDSVTEELEEDTTELLSKSADHVHATRHAVQGLARSHPRKALSLAGRLNTRPRRDRGVISFLNSVLDQPLRGFQPKHIFCTLNQIESEQVRNQAISKVFERLAAERTDLKKAAAYAELFFSDVERMVDAEAKFIAAIRAYSIRLRYKNEIEDDEKKDDIAKSYLSVAENTFDSQDHNSRKIETAYHVVDDLATVDRKTARDFKQKAEKLRSNITFDHGKARASYLASLYVTIRAFRGLLPKNEDRPSDSDRLLEAIERLTSKESRVHCFSKMAFAFFRSERNAEGKKIVDEKIRPLLDQVEETPSLKSDLWTYSAPVLFFSAKKRTLNNLSDQDFPVEKKDKALFNIANSIIRKVMPSDPVDSETDAKYKLNAEEIYDLVDIIKKSNSDSVIYKLIDLTINVILDDKYQKRYDRSLRIRVSNEIENIASNKLPNKNYIKHEGYLLLVKANLLLLKDTYTDIGISEWLDLIKRGRSIENDADSAFVLSILAEKCPSSKGQAQEHRIEALKNAEEKIKGLPSEQDRVDRFNILANSAEEVDRELARKYYKQALSSLYDEREKIDSTTVKDVQRRILSSAYRLDPDFASSLANLVDDDPAHQEELQRNIERLKQRSSLSTAVDEEGGAGDPSLPRVCWEGLSALNANRLTPVRVKRAKQILDKSKGFPTEYAYPIQSFVTEGIVRSYKDTDEAGKFIRPLFDAGLQNTHFIERLVVRSSNKQDQARAQALEADSAKDSIMIRSGERKKALHLLKEWVDSNVNERLIICDQYFGPEEIEAIYLVQSVAPSCEIQILSSEKHHRQNKAMDLESAYTKAWRDRYDQEMPKLRIVVAGKQDGTKRSPFHDRWWLSEQEGIRIGTSFNGLGRGQDTEVSQLGESERASKTEEIEQYLIHNRREHNGVEVKYRIEMF